MEEMFKIDSVSQYNSIVGVETLHPMISVIDVSKSNSIAKKYKGRMYFGIYAIYLKDVKCGDLKYGRHNYDYQEGTIVCISPGQVLTIEETKEEYQPKGRALLFHPDFIHGTSLGHQMKNYGFFSYESNEALHISEQERATVMDCLLKIEKELNHAIDKHTRTLITTNIQLLLDYCLRYYERQFITRVNVNKDILVRFEKQLSAYFQSDKPETLGLPSVRYFADQLNLSANYFGDLIKKETGKSAQEYIQLNLIEIAKERVFDTSKSVSEIAYELGFKYPQHFSRLFKKCVGYSPNEYREHHV